MSHAEMVSAARRPVVQALVKTVAAAPTEEKEELARALETFARHYPTLYNKLTLEKGFAADLFDAIEDALGPV